MTDPTGQQPEGPDEHQADGLDLARSITRSTAGSTPRAKRKRRRPDADGPPQSRSSASYADDRDPQLLGDTVGRLVDDQGWELDLRMRGVFARWPELVGDEIAAHSTPETFTEGKLVVRADSTAWATQLRLLSSQVVQRLNEELGHGTVTLIEVEGPHGPSWKKGRRSVRGGRGPRDTYG